MTVKSKASALGIAKNTPLRGEDLRTRSYAYWTHEVCLMREVMEESEVGLLADMNQMATPQITASDYRSIGVWSLLDVSGPRLL